MMAEYGWSISDALFLRPVTVIFAMIPAISLRLGGEEGPGHADHAAANARLAKEAELRARFKIVPNPKPTA